MATRHGLGKAIGRAHGLQHQADGVPFAVKGVDAFLAASQGQSQVMLGADRSRQQQNAVHGVGRQVVRGTKWPRQRRSYSRSGRWLGWMRVCDNR
jgi:hypothetical protein